MNWTPSSREIRCRRGMWRGFVGREAIVPYRERVLEERLRGIAPQGDAGADRHIPSNAPVPDGAVAERLHGLLLRDEPEDLLRLDELLPGLSDADVDHDLLDSDVPHSRHRPT